MLVQRREGGLRLIAQHDHALLAGELAQAWRGVREGGASARGARPGEGASPVGGPHRAEDALSVLPVLATALHDLAWLELDEQPLLDPARGAPFPFDRHPLEKKLTAYGRGLDRLERIHPGAAFLCSLHYASFPEGPAAAAFLASERTRRDRLLEVLEEREGRGKERVRAELAEALAWLRFFDRMSLRICLAAPGAAEAGLPSWLDRSAKLRPPVGPSLELHWRDGGTLRVRPWPFGHPLALAVPVRDLPAPPYGDQEELDRAWGASCRRSWRLAVVAWEEDG